MIRVARSITGLPRKRFKRWTATDRRSQIARCNEGDWRWVSVVVVFVLLATATHLRFVASRFTSFNTQSAARRTR